MKKLDFEAHFYTQEYVDTLYHQKGYPRFGLDEETRGRRLWYNPAVGQPFADFLLEALLDVGKGRLARMDKCGIDTQILSLSAPGVEQLDPAIGSVVAGHANDALSELTRKYPHRFMGYAALAPRDPARAADELERCVTKLGFKGWNTHSNFGDSYLDDKKYLPILQRAAQLGVPVYLHPTVPAIAQVQGYGFALAGAPFGFGLETALCMMRLIYSGAFDTCPGLKIILGHLGEALPFLFKRIDWAYVRPFDPAARPKLSRKPSEYLKDNVFVTTSGNYYAPAFMCTHEALGVENILLGTDYPYEDPEECIEFIEGLPLPQAEKEAIYSVNARRLGFTL
jgi:predicted TIM-barrel fold metal-dependent hydrolase